jgi:hypothetical protein
VETVERRIWDLGPERGRCLVQLRMPSRHRSEETGGVGVSFAPERGTTQTTVKVPKSWLSVNGTKVSIVTDREEVGLEAATL